ncbi:MAG: dTDP-glucose 4,6-dehydratase 2 [Candidatus Cloacimonetes bacterium ADurb.Bin088]|jgi:dTDP-glucose 4,6-dehydratase|nr:MAG: dTDP-glucose 4,6-dehydratase 2 [Candidatus Cloacimonetes bacterium ADurb.Bin088]
MKRILVTGGAGFIGANYIHHLFEDPGFDGMVYNVDKLTYAGNTDSLKDIVDKFSGRYFFKHADICDSDTIAEIFSSFRPDTVVNFAAESHVDRSIDGPMEFVNTNVLGTAVMLDVALRHYKKLEPAEQAKFRFHHVSTDEVFGSLGDEGKFTEETPYDPSSPYSASKASSDHMVRAWHRTFGLPVLISNCSNNYGGYQFPEKLIPLMILNCLEHKPLPVYGKGLNVRDWLYVRDHCDAINTIIRKGRLGETYNVGGNNEMTNIEIVNTICSLLDEMTPSDRLGSYKELITYVQDRPGHDLRYAIDASKIQNELGWSPRETFATGIRKTVAWYLEHRDWWRDIQCKKYQQQRLGLG